jgi:hypothetical protein
MVSCVSPEQKNVMMFPKKNIRVILLIIILAAGIGVWWRVVRQPASLPRPVPVVAQLAPTDMNTPEGLQTVRAYWEDETRARGAIAAYAQLKTEYATASFTNQHTAAHIFGRLLYVAEGVEGVRVCDAEFAFGCFHGFFGAAVAAEGVDVVADLDAACVGAFGVFGTGCQHGLGHGLMEYFGAGRLEDALGACRRTTQRSPLFGCTSGALMEYNTPTILSDTDTVIESRQLDRAHPLAPCPDFGDSAFGLSCMYELAQWWGSSGESIDTMAQWCRQAQTSREREACMLGVGNATAVRTGFMAEDVARSCAALARNADRTSCLAGAGWSIFAQTQQKQPVHALCGANTECVRQAAVICLYISEPAAKRECEAVNSFKF